MSEPTDASADSVPEPRTTPTASPTAPSAPGGGSHPPAPEPQTHRATTPPFTNEERSVGYTRADWSEHYNDGRGFRRLGEEEMGLLVKHAPAPEGGRALDVCCGTGCFGKDRVPRRSCRFTRRLSLGVVSRCDEPSCSFPEAPL